MKRSRLSFGDVAVMIAAVVAVVVATSGGTAKITAPRTVVPASTISVKQTSLGKTLVDANGRVLYLFRGDKPDHSTLSAAGQAIWPPLTSATKPGAGAGVIESRITLIKGAGGTGQVAYNGHPLYYYIGDRAPGQTRGQGLNQFGALWYVLSPNGTAITSAPTTPAPSGSGTSGYGYGY
jgi:predicted lipoprotein with Yx(FWY)xxD motif